MLQDVLEYDLLKKGTEDLYKKYVNKELPKPIVDDEIENEYKNQTKYLEKTVQVLKKNLEKDKHIHK